MGAIALQVLAGAGIRAGQVIGETEELGYFVTQDKHTVRDLQATILQLLGLDPYQSSFPCLGLNQRLIGRSMRAVVDLDALGERLVTVDCDVLEADGGTRTAAITGGYLALVDALWSIRRQLPDPRALPLHDSVAAVSVGIVNTQAQLDLDYAMDASAAVDMNVVMTGRGRYVEIQGTGEEATFTDAQLGELLQLAHHGVRQLTELQRQTLGTRWPVP